MDSKRKRRDNRHFPRGLASSLNLCKDIITTYIMDIDKSNYLKRFTVEKSKTRSSRDEAIDLWLESLDNYDNVPKLLARIKTSIHPRKVTAQALFELHAYFKEGSQRSGIPFGALFWSQTDPQKDGTKI